MRHAYKRDNHQVALCGYDGPSTWKAEWIPPSNVCQICLALLLELCDLENRRWLNGYDEEWAGATALAESWCQTRDPVAREREIYCYRAGYLRAKRQNDQAHTPRA